MSDPQYIGQLLMHFVWPTLEEAHPNPVDAVAMFIECNEVDEIALTEVWQAVVRVGFSHAALKPILIFIQHSAFKHTLNMDPLGWLWRYNYRQCLQTHFEAGNEEELELQARAVLFDEVDDMITNAPTLTFTRIMFDVANDLFRAFTAPNLKLNLFKHEENNYLTNHPATPPPTPQQAPIAATPDLSPSHGQTPAIEQAHAINSPEEAQGVPADALDCLITTNIHEESENLPLLIKDASHGWPFPVVDFDTVGTETKFLQCYKALMQEEFHNLWALENAGWVASLDGSLSNPPFPILSTAGRPENILTSTFGSLLTELNTPC
ncbi:hypothetical protein DXG01_016949 [Tephrocybe rancida]|nr:hypothetical protein DXG01_016949 [Tephrocybe rancida]